jgi:hypothetical protein
MDSFPFPILLFFIILLSLYLLYRLFQKRSQYFQYIQQQEGFVSENSTTIISSLLPVNETFAELPIQEYVIKASFNSAYGSDHKISASNLKNVIENEKSRFLDFEVYEQDQKPVIGYSSSHDNIIDSENTEPFHKIMEVIAMNAFATNNGNDPLFLHFRIKSENQVLLSDIATTLENTFREKVYSENVTGKTKLSKLIGKVVFIIDVSPQYSANYNSIVCNKTDAKCLNLRDVVHMNSNSSTLLSTIDSKVVTQQNDPPKITDGRRTTVTNWQMATPDLHNYTNSNTDFFFKLVNDYGIQIVMHQFYIHDKALERYKTFFESLKSAYVPLSAALSYIQTNGGSD